VIADVDTQLTWYTARAAGLVAWAVVSVGIMLGLALSTRLVRRKGAPAWLLDLHRFLGTLTAVFVAIHILALWADSFVPFGPRELFVPMASTWRPGAVAWGIVALYLVVAIQLTSWVIRRLPRRVWHSVHLSSYVVFVAATLHAFEAGADRANVAIQWAALTGTVAVTFLVTFRVLGPRRTRRAAVLEQRRAAA
jgi:DMSO/TMAO reductase YedYZ heme-binding membrane subunit